MCTHVVYTKWFGPTDRDMHPPAGTSFKVCIYFLYGWTHPFIFLCFLQQHDVSLSLAHFMYLHCDKTWEWSDNKTDKNTNHKNKRKQQEEKMTNCCRWDRKKKNSKGLIIKTLLNKRSKPPNKNKQANKALRWQAKTQSKPLFTVESLLLSASPSSQVQVQTLYRPSDKVQQ